MLGFEIVMRQILEIVRVLFELISSETKLATFFVRPHPVVADVKTFQRKVLNVFNNSPIMNVLTCGVDCSTWYLEFRLTRVVIDSPINE